MACAFRVAVLDDWISSYLYLESYLSLQIILHHFLSHLGPPSFLLAGLGLSRGGRGKPGSNPGI